MSGECPISLHFHHTLTDQTDVSHQLITCYDITKAKKENMGEGQGRLLWGFRTAPQRVLWVLLLNSRGERVYIRVPVRCLAMSGMRESWLWSQTRQTLWTGCRIAFSKQIWGFYMLLLQTCACVLAGGNEVSHESQHLTNKPRVDTLNSQKTTHMKTK